MNYGVIYEMLKEIENKNSGNSIEFDDYLKVLKKKEVNDFLNKSFKNKTSVLEVELNRYKPEIRQLIEIYCLENDIEIKDEEIDSEKSNLSAIRLLMNEISRFKLLTKEEEIELVKEIKENNSQEAKEKFICANLRLVVSIAKRYAKGDTETFLDCVGDGNLGLLAAVDKFDLKRECKFSTCATWWIEQAIRRGQANNLRTIRVPVHAYERLNKIRRIKNEYELAHGVEPTEEYVAKQLGMELNAYKKFVLLTTEPLSGDLVVHDDEPGADSVFFDFIPDENDANNIEKIVMLKTLRKDLEDKLDTLSEKEKEVLKLRFGFDDDMPKTLEQVGEMYGVTRERIRQIEAKALRKMRQQSRCKYMKDYLS